MLALQICRSADHRRRAHTSTASSHRAYTGKELVRLLGVAPGPPGLARSGRPGLLPAACCLPPPASCAALCIEQMVHPARSDNGRFQGGAQERRCLRLPGAQPPPPPPPPPPPQPQPQLQAQASTSAPLRPFFRPHSRPTTHHSHAPSIRMCPRLNDPPSAPVTRKHECR